jgi:hypothetical protein
LLGRCQSHGPLAPIFNVLVIVQFKVFTKLPTATLLFASRGTVVRQVGIGIIVKEARHYFDLLWMSIYYSHQTNKQPLKCMTTEDRESGLKLQRQPTIVATTSVRSQPPKPKETRILRDASTARFHSSKSVT